MKIAQEKALRRWLHDASRVFAAEEDGPNVRVMELATGKQLLLDLRAIELAESRMDSVSGNPYWIVVLPTGHQLVLCEHGFAFAPDFRNTGAIELPSSVFCLADFRRMIAQLKENAVEHPEDRRGSVDLVMVLIALLDGARNVGLDVDAESERVERLLEAIEKQSISEGD